MSPPARVKRITRDLCTIGGWAPVRVAYELSRRTGFHGLLFNAQASQSAPPVSVNDVLTVPSIGDLPASVRARTLAAATSIVDGQVRLFSRDEKVGADPDWHATIDGSGSWPDLPWWKLELRSADRPGDVK